MRTTAALLFALVLGAAACAGSGADDNTADDGSGTGQDAGAEAPADDSY